MENSQLVKLALEARQKSYSPYSGFAVGAALLSKDGKVFTGCNIENISFSPTICAERTAIFKAVSEGVKDFEKIAIVGGKHEEGFYPHDYAYPCGVCRQVMTEFCDLDSFELIIGRREDDFKVYKLKEVLPYSFTIEEGKK